MIFPYFVTQQASLPQLAPMASAAHPGIHNEIVAAGPGTTLNHPTGVIPDTRKARDPEPRGQPTQPYPSVSCAPRPIHLPLLRMGGIVISEINSQILS